MTTVNGASLPRAYSRYVKTIKPRLFLVCGWAALGIGAAGLVLPVLPTVPFVLLAAACFVRGSERWHGWLVSHPTFGPQIADYLAGRGIRPHAKAVALLTLWASVLVTVLVIVPLLAADIALLVVAAAVSAYILRLPTCRARGTDDDGAQGGAGSSGS